MFCVKCGSVIPNGNKFCPSCGVSVRGGGSPDWLKKILSNKRAIAYICNALIAIVVLGFIANKIFNPIPMLKDQSIELLRGALEKNTELMEHVVITDVKNCMLVHKSGNEYSGFADVVFKAKNAKSKIKPKTIQYSFNITHDGDTIMLSDGEPTNGVMELLPFFSDDDDNSEATE